MSRNRSGNQQSKLTDRQTIQGPKRNKTKIQTMIYTTLRRKLKIEQDEPSQIRVELTIIY